MMSTTYMGLLFRKIPKCDTGHHHQHKIHNDVEHIPYSTQRIKINQRNVGTEIPGDGSTVVPGDSSI